MFNQIKSGNYIKKPSVYEYKKKKLCELDFAQNSLVSDTKFIPFTTGDDWKIES